MVQWCIVDAERGVDPVPWTPQRKVWRGYESVTPFRHAALLRIRCNLTVQVLFAMPADPGTGSRIRMM